MPRQLHRGREFRTAAVESKVRGSLVSCRRGLRSDDSRFHRPTDTSQEESLPREFVQPLAGWPRRAQWCRNLRDMVSNGQCGAGPVDPDLHPIDVLNHVAVLPWAVVARPICVTAFATERCRLGGAPSRSSFQKTAQPPESASPRPAAVRSRATAAVARGRPTSPACTAAAI